MKPLEAFSPKDVRTCARILDLLAGKGLDLSDLRSHAAHMRFMAGWGMRLIFRGVSFDEKEIDVHNGLGWYTLRTWLRIKRILGGKTEEEIRSFVQAERKKWLEKEFYGAVRP